MYNLTFSYSHCGLLMHFSKSLIVILCEELSPTYTNIFSTHLTYINLFNMSFTYINLVNILGTTTATIYFKPPFLSFTINSPHWSRPCTINSTKVKLHASTSHESLDN